MQRIQRPVGLPTPVKDIEQHTEVLRSVKEALEIAQRQRGEPMKSFVRLEELRDLGLTDDDGTLLPINPGTPDRRLRAQLLLRSS